MRSLLSPMVLLSSCATLGGVRPLEPGTHEVGVSVGGGVVLLGETPIPLPNVIAQGRSGVGLIADRPVALDYGLNLTALPFGVAATHLGGSWLMARQSQGVPALTLTNRVWFASNLLGFANRDSKRFSALGVDQLEVDASWLVGGQLLYGGLAQYTDFVAPALALSPALGATFDFTPVDDRGLRLSVEGRWYGVNLERPSQNVEFAGGGQGTLGVALGLHGQVGGSRRAP